jgi:phosphoribosylanthranilate isomerase
VPVKAKICGINTGIAMRAAVDGGAAYVGLVFYPPSPRAVTAAQAATLAAMAPPPVIRVGLFVDPTDEEIDAVLRVAPLDLLQLHGAETPARVAAVRERTGIPVMKAIKVAGAADLDGAADYAGVADRLLFDAKAPPEMTGALPGGNALAFDWELLGGRSWPCPWMLSGGLDAENLAEAVRISGARAVDVSSGVESAPGTKDPAKIAAFLKAARDLR